jgi:hypothetical protein
MRGGKERVEGRGEVKKIEKEREGARDGGGR